MHRDRDPRRQRRPERAPRVLLVHDDAGCALLIKEAFAWQGCRVRIDGAGTVGEALRRLREPEPPEAVLVALPPYRGGDDFVARARFARIALGIPIVQLVHLHRACDEDRSLAFGADLYLELPVGWDGYRHLVDATRQLLALRHDEEDEVGARAQRGEA
jgi:DNA-binding response OmpR family regulator